MEHPIGAPLLFLGLTASRWLRPTIIDMDLPVTSIERVWHVGDMDLSSKSSFSLEGNGLSVSQHPDAWEQIAQLGGAPWWALCKPSASFCDAIELSTEQQAEITRWGIESGWVELVDRFRVSYFDEELEDEVYYYTSDATDADEGEEVAAVQVISPTPSMTTRLSVHCDADVGCFDLLLSLYVEDETDLDGIWWYEELDPARYSAPRGVIVPTRLDGWLVEPTSEREYLSQVELTC